MSCCCRRVRGLGSSCDRKGNDIALVVYTSEGTERVRPVRVPRSPVGIETDGNEHVLQQGGTPRLGQLLACDERQRDRVVQRPEAGSNAVWTILADARATYL